MAYRGSDVSFGDYNLQATECGWVTARQIERRVSLLTDMSGVVENCGSAFSPISQSKKPLETRMGRGKGAPDQWVVVIRPGRVLYEIEGVDEATAREAFRLASHKLPIQTTFLKRGEIR